MVNKIKIIAKELFKEFVYGGHILSLSGVAIAMSISLMLNEKVNLESFVIIYLTSQIIYLHDRYREFNKDIYTNSERTLHVKKYLNNILFIVLILIILNILILFYFSTLTILSFWFFIIVTGLLYSKVFKKLTRNIIGFKNYFVSFMWILLFIFFAFYNNYAFLNIYFFYILLIIFIKILIHEIFSDIKDLRIDRREYLKTFASLMDRSSLLRMLYSLNYFIAILIFIGVYLNIMPDYAILLIVSALYVIYYFKKLDDVMFNKSLLYNVVVDGEFIFWPIIIYLGKILI